MITLILSFHGTHCCYAFIFVSVTEHIRICFNVFLTEYSSDSHENGSWDSYLLLELDTKGFFIIIYLINEYKYLCFKNQA